MTDKSAGAKSLSASGSELEQQAKSELDLQASKIDINSEQRLNAARRCAIEAARQGNRESFSVNRWWSRSFLSPMLAVSMLVLVAIFLNSNEDNTEAKFSQLQDDFNMVLTNNDFDILQEDIEFYVWMESEPVMPEPPADGVVRG